MDLYVEDKIIVNNVLKPDLYFLFFLLLFQQIIILGKCYPLCHTNEHKGPNLSYYFLIRQIANYILNYCQLSTESYPISYQH